MKAARNKTVVKKSACALLGASTSVNESMVTTAAAIVKASTPDLAALFKPMKILGDYDVCAGEDGKDEVTRKYKAMTPGQVAESMNNIVDKYLSPYADKALGEYIHLNPDSTILDWAHERGHTITFRGKPVEFIGKQHTDVTVLHGGKQIGRVVKNAGKPYEFIPASFEYGPDDYAKLGVPL